MRYIVMNVKAGKSLERNGFRLQLAMSEKPKIVYATEEAAREAAQQEAMEHPGSMFVVLAPITFFEAKVPSLIEKSFVNGEVVLKEKAK